MNPFRPVWAGTRRLQPTYLGGLSQAGGGADNFSKHQPMRVKKSDLWWIATLGFAIGVNLMCGLDRMIAGGSYIHWVGSTTLWTICLFAKIKNL